MPPSKNHRIRRPDQCHYCKTIGEDKGIVPVLGVCPEHGVMAEVHACPNCIPDPSNDKREFEHSPGVCELLIHVEPV